MERVQSGASCLVMAAAQPSARRLPPPTAAARFQFEACATCNYECLRLFDPYRQKGLFRALFPLVFRFANSNLID
jgi:hypothetical protein